MQRYLLNFKFTNAFEERYKLIEDFESHYEERKLKIPSFIQRNSAESDYSWNSRFKAHDDMVTALKKCIDNDYIQNYQTNFFADYHYIKSCRDEILRKINSFATYINSPILKKYRSYFFSNVYNGYKFENSPKEEEMEALENGTYEKTNLWLFEDKKHVEELYQMILKQYPEMYLPCLSSIITNDKNDILENGMVAKKYVNDETLNYIDRERIGGISLFSIYDISSYTESELITNVVERSLFYIKSETITVPINLEAVPPITEEYSYDIMTSCQGETILSLLPDNLLIDYLDSGHLPDIHYDVNNWERKDAYSIDTEKEISNSNTTEYSDDLNYKVMKTI